MIKTLLILNLLLISCKSPIPKHLKVYVGDVKERCLIRKQDNELICCGDKKFDGIMCMDGEDFRQLLKRCPGE